MCRYLPSPCFFLSQPRVHSVYHREIAQVELAVKNLLANAGEARAVGSVPGEGNSNPLQYACHGQRSLAGYTPWGCKGVRHTLLLSTLEAPVCLHFLTVVLGG